MNGGPGPEAEAAARYLRIASIGLPAALVALSGQGYLRGTGDLRSPLIILIVANLANVGLELWLVYGLDLGPRRQRPRHGHRPGRNGRRLRVAAAARAGRARAGRASPALRPLLNTGGHLLVRTGALLACFTLATAVAARVRLGRARRQRDRLSALRLPRADPRRGGDRRPGADRPSASARAGARTRARRRGGCCWWSLVVGCAFGLVLLAGSRLIPGLFTDDPAVVDAAANFWWLFALMQPVGALVFALDGILIGAGDTRFLALAMVGAAAVFIPVLIARPRPRLGPDRDLGCA